MKVVHSREKIIELFLRNFINVTWE